GFVGEIECCGANVVYGAAFARRGIFAPPGFVAPAHLQHALAEVGREVADEILNARKRVRKIAIGNEVFSLRPQALGDRHAWLRCLCPHTPFPPKPCVGGATCVKGCASLALESVMPFSDAPRGAVCFCRRDRKRCPGGRRTPSTR